MLQNSTGGFLVWLLLLLLGALYTGLEQVFHFIAYISFVTMLALLHHINWLQYVYISVDWQRNRFT